MDRYLRAVILRLLPTPRRLGLFALLLLMPCVATCLGACRAAPLEVVLFFPPRALDASHSGAPSLGPQALPIHVAPVEDQRARPEIIGELRGFFSLVTGRIRASNDGRIWVRGAATYELTRAGLVVLDQDQLADRDQGQGLLRLELNILSARAASSEDHPGEIVLAAILRRDGDILSARRISGSSSIRDDSGVRVDPAESLALCLRGALRAVVQEASAAAVEGAEDSDRVDPQIPTSD